MGNRKGSAVYGANVPRDDRRRTAARRRHRRHRRHLAKPTLARVRHTHPPVIHRPTMASAPPTRPVRCPSSWTAGSPLRRASRARRMKRARRHEQLLR